MTLNKAALAIDGALTNAALARVGTFATSSGTEGVVQATDLKVSVSGNVFSLAGGAALVLNRYQTAPNQMYVVANDGPHSIGAGLMPPSSPSQQTYIVAVAVGDKEFSQAGHPFMAATDPPVGQESTFEYVRPIVVLESAFNSRNYPAVPLARAVIPANTVTFTNAMLTDIRALARPRTDLRMAHVAGPASDNNLNGGGGTPGTYEKFPNVTVITTVVPPWAKKAKIIGFIEGLKLTKAGTGKIRAYVEGQSTPSAVTNLDENTGTTVRRSYSFGGEIDVSAYAGTTKSFSVEATPNDTASKGAWVADNKTSVGMQVYFEENPA